MSKALSKQTLVCKCLDRVEAVMVEKSLLDDLQGRMTCGPIHRLLFILRTVKFSSIHCRATGLPMPEAARVRWVPDIHSAVPRILTVFEITR